MSDEQLSQRGLQRMTDENIQSDITQGENRADFIEEEAIPQSSTGVIQRLISVGNQLQDISENEPDPDRKKAYFEGVSDELQRLTIEIQQMMDMLSSQQDQPDVSEIVMEFTQALDKQFLESSELFLSAVEFYYNYMETEDPNLLNEALERIELGTVKLEQADVGTRALGEILTSTSGRFDQA